MRGSKTHTPGPRPQGSGRGKAPAVASSQTPHRYMRHLPRPVFIVLACPNSNPHHRRRTRAGSARGCACAFRHRGARPLDSGRGGLRWLSGEVPSPLVGPRGPGGQAGHSLVLQRLFFHARVCGLWRVVACACPPLRGATPRQKQSRLHCPRSPATFRRSHPTQQIKHIPHPAPAWSPPCRGFFIFLAVIRPIRSRRPINSTPATPAPLAAGTYRRHRHVACCRLRPATRRAGFVARARRCAR